MEELLRERGVWVDYTTVFRCVQSDAPELDGRRRPYLRATNDLYRMDERYIRIKKQWHYLHRAVDSQGQTLDLCSVRAGMRRRQSTFSARYWVHSTYALTPSDYRGPECYLSACLRRVTVRWDPTGDVYTEAVQVCE